MFCLVFSYWSETNNIFETRSCHVQFFVCFVQTEAHFCIPTQILRFGHKNYISRKKFQSKSGICICLYQICQFSLIFGNWRISECIFSVFSIGETFFCVNIANPSPNEICMDEFHYCYCFHPNISSYRF